MRVRLAERGSGGSERRGSCKDCNRGIEKGEERETPQGKEEEEGGEGDQKE